MTDRRCHRRFHLPDATAAIRLLQDVALDSIDGSHVSVISRSPAAAGGEMLLHISGRNGRAQTLTVRSVESKPLLMDRVLRHYVRLCVVRSRIVRGLPGPGTDELRTEDAAIASVLERRLPARVLDISARGCLLEMQSPVDVGASALLDVEVDGTGYIEMIRICRTTAATGMPHRIGAEFLPTFERLSRSLRPFVSRMEARHAGLQIAFR